MSQGFEPSFGPSGDLLALVDYLLQRLPERYRQPITLCELHGLERKEAACQLGVGPLAVSRRLARGKNLLRQQLARHGAPVSAASLPIVLAQLSERNQKSA